MQSRIETAIAAQTAALQAQLAKQHSAILKYQRGQAKQYLIWSVTLITAIVGFATAFIKLG